MKKIVLGISANNIYDRISERQTCSASISDDSMELLLGNMSRD